MVREGADKSCVHTCPLAQSLTCLIHGPERPGWFLPGFRSSVRVLILGSLVAWRVWQPLVFPSVVTRGQKKLTVSERVSTGLLCHPQPAVGLLLHLPEVLDRHQPGESVSRPYFFSCSLWGFPVMP